MRKYQRFSQTVTENRTRKADEEQDEEGDF